MASSPSPDEHTNLLRELGIPGRTKEPISTSPDVWGLNIAAVLDNFPRHGLQCTAGPWGTMGQGDSLVIFWGPDNQVLQKTVEKNEVDTQLQLFVEPRHILAGNFDVSYSVTRLGQTAEPSEVMKVFVKLTRPGGHDDNEEPGHSKLIMHIPREILDGGIDKDNVAAGVDIRIEPYPNIAPGDVIRLSWGGVFVSSPPLTQDQVEGKTPIVIHVDEATIRDAGDSDSTGLAVAFELYDKVDNRSEDWSVAQRVVVSIDTARPLAPLLKETLNNVLDLDKLGDAKGTGQVVAMDGKVFAKGDTVFLQLKGTPVEGTPIDRELPGVIVESVPSILEIPIDNALLRRFAKVQMVLLYRIQKADGSADILSKGQFISVIGQLQRLKAPIAEDAEQGALDPDLPRTRIEIPWDDSFESGQAIKLFWLGTLPDFTPYLPDLPLRPITHGDVNDKVSLYITVDSAHIKVLEGGTLELYYQLLSEDGVLAKLDHYSAINAIRESEHAPLLAVGEPRLELPMPKVEGVVDNVLDPDRNGTTLSATWLNTLVGDKVTREWVGSKTGPDSDWIILNSFTAGREVPFPISADLIKGNENGTVQARYFVERAGERTRHSQPLDFNVGAAQELDPPTITQVVDAKGAAIDNGGTTVDTQVTLSGAGAKGQKVQIKDGTAVKGEATVNLTTGLWELTVTGLSVTAHSFTATALYGEGTVSTPWTLTVTASTAPTITQVVDAKGVAIADGGTTVDTTITLSGAGAKGQKVQIKDGDTVKGEATVNLTTGLWELTVTGLSVTAHSFTAIALYGEGTVSTPWTLTVTASTAPTITQAVDSKGAPIDNGGTTVDTSVTLSGAGAKGQKVQIKDGTTVKGEATVNLTTGLWELTVTGLSVAAHSFTAIALYGSGQVSAAWTLTVTASTAPTITRAENSRGEEILPGGATFETSVKLKGGGAKGQKVQIKDGVAVKGEAAVNLTTGLWELTMTGLSLGEHSFTATALYGSGEVSGSRVVVVLPPITLREDFENRSGSDPIRLDIPTMTIERNPGTGWHIIIFLSTVYEPPISGKILHINGGNSTTTFTFKENYSYIAFNYAHTIYSAIAKFYDSSNRLLGEITLFTESLYESKFAQFQGNGIRKMIVTTKDSAVTFDNFMFSR